MAVGEDVQDARPDDCPQDETDPKIVNPLAVEPELARFPPHHPKTKQEAERERGEVGRDVEPPQQRNIDPEVDQDRAHGC